MAPASNPTIESIAVAAGAVSMTIDPANGARLLGFSLEGKNVLLDARAVAGTENANNFGATFWPSPQAAWGWPPIPAIDGDAYTVSRRDGDVVLTSGAGTLLDGAQVTLTKTIRPIPERAAIDVGYVMKNVGRTTTHLAPWQIARVRAGGLTFFRLGPGGVTGDKLATVTQAGVQWYEYEPAVVVAQGQKTFADATGWLAHLDGDLLLVQAFPDVLPGGAAAGEAEVELYADPSHTYVEIEPQGRLLTLEPGQASEPWVVRWSLRRLPHGIARRVGNPELIALVESTIAS